MSVQPPRRNGVTSYEYFVKPVAMHDFEVYTGKANGAANESETDCGATGMSWLDLQDPFHKV